MPQQKYQTIKLFVKCDPTAALSDSLSLFCRWIPEFRQISVLGPLKLFFSGTPMHDIMGSSPEVLSWTSCPSLLVGKLKEELKLTVVGDAMKKTNSPNPHPQPPQVPPSNLPPQIITDLAPPTHLPVPLQTPGQDEDSMLRGISPLNTALSVDSTRSEGQHFENSVLQLQDQDEAGSPASCEHGGCRSGMEEQMGEGDCSMDQCEEGKQGQHQPEDIKLHFHRAGPGSGGFLEGLFGCLRPVLNIIGKTYSTEYKLQQQGSLVVSSA